MAVFYSHSEEETLRFAEEYAKTLCGGDVVLLDGEMGAGKTVLAKGIARGLGVKEEVTSPTFAYLNIYRGDEVLSHFDFYRIGSEEQAIRLGLADALAGGGVCLVEWGENVRGLIPPSAKRVTISGSGDGVREIKI